MYRVEYFSKTSNTWVLYSSPKNFEYAALHADLLTKRGDIYRIIHDGKVVDSSQEAK